MSRKLRVFHPAKSALPSAVAVYDLLGQLNTIIMDKPIIDELTHKLAQLTAELAVHRQSMLNHSQAHFTKTTKPNHSFIIEHSKEKRRIVPELVSTHN